MQVRNNLTKHIVRKTQMVCSTIVFVQNQLFITKMSKSTRWSECNSYEEHQFLNGYAIVLSVNIPSTKFTWAMRSVNCWFIHQLVRNWCEELFINVTRIDLLKPTTIQASNCWKYHTDARVESRMVLLQSSVWALFWEEGEEIDQVA